MQKLQASAGPAAAVGVTFLDCEVADVQFSKPLAYFISAQLGNGEATRRGLNSF